MNQANIDQNENKRIRLRKDIKEMTLCTIVLMLITFVIMFYGYNIASNSYDNSIYGSSKCNSHSRIACLSNCGCAWCGECLNANDTKWCSQPSDAIYADFCPKDVTVFYIYALVLCVPAIIMAAFITGIRDKCAELRLLSV
jgi:hypothetical protein